MAQGAQPVRSAGTTSWLRIATAVVLALVAAVIVWLILKGDDAKQTSSPATSSAATLETIAALPNELGHAVYWAGTRSGYTYEVTEVDGSVFIRYLPPGIDIGDPRPKYLTVGTYRLAQSYTALRRQGSEPGNAFRRTHGGGIAVWSKRSPQTVLVAYPRSAVKVEVYDPSATRALRLAISGAVKPIR
jgi:hypothetical protein